jgi:pre-rRNA-processing protein IPI3
MDEMLRDQAYFLRLRDPSLQATAASSAVVESGPRVEALEAEVAKLREQLARAKEVNDSMWETVVKKVVKGSEPGAEENERAKKKGKI